MNKTIDYYNRNAALFVSGTLHADISDCRNRFLHYVKPGGRLLDAGCGSGRDALAFVRAGYPVDAFDASEELCRFASELLGFPVRCERFEDLTGTSLYDGIWACASLLHVRGADLPDAVRRLKELLKPEGVLYASFKEGTSEREKDGRFFHDMTADSCRDLFRDAGLEVLEVFRSGDVREGRADETWVNIIVKKRG
ncbi:MAG: class I SAM-dependent methyltransferase [Lachnospiraceae bacterium]|nr:class I SAM-dependent methyltransferase [Lachnospiraceae bacterium]MBP5253791.1 class I SAM-dependent methyltransferase [Lachnospiraceae bacterium]